jgi:alpha-ketoglutarate-dependent taurine dioxygenase
MGHVTVEPIDATLGAVVTGVKLAALDDDTWAEIEAAFNDHGVLVFPDQHLVPEEQQAFGLRFGPLETFGRAEATPTPISNQRRDGTLVKSDETTGLILRGNEGWHTDSSYMPVAAKASMLTAHVVPSHGGQTSWADMRAAYDGLAPEMKAKLEPLAAYHSLRYSQAKVGPTDKMSGNYGFFEGPPPRRPLIKVHPDTGRRSLFIGRHAYGVTGMSEEESAALLDELLEYACQPPRTYTHDWNVGDLVVWDNRCVLHRVEAWAWDEPRVMIHTRVLGNPVTEASL